MLITQQNDHTTWFFHGLLNDLRNTGHYFLAFVYVFTGMSVTKFS